MYNRTTVFFSLLYSFAIFNVQKTSHNCCIFRNGRYAFNSYLRSENFYIMALSNVILHTREKEWGLLVNYLLLLIWNNASTDNCLKRWSTLSTTCKHLCSSKQNIHTFLIASFLSPLFSLQLSFSHSFSLFRSLWLFYISFEITHENTSLIIEWELNII